MLTCMTAGPAGTAVTLVLPGLADTLPRPGRYRIQAPGVVPHPDSLAHLARAEALVPAADGITYRGMGGELVLEAEPGGGRVGSYMVAFERAPEVPPGGRGWLHRHTPPAHVHPGRRLKLAAWPACGCPQRTSPAP